MPQSSQESPLTVAIDGPAAAGKSSVARAVAVRLGLTYVDTGAMYRVLTLKALRSGVDPEDGPSLARLAAETSIEFRPSSVPGQPQEVWLGDENVTREIRTREVDLAVSAVSKHPAVRDWFRTFQRRMAQAGGVVMEGRDIGTVILPHAEIKVYLDASFEKRVLRRFRELVGKGYRTEKQVVWSDMARRDLLDSSRKVAPLAIAPDAFRVDTTRKTLGQVVDEVTRLCLGRRGAL